MKRNIHRIISLVLAAAMLIPLLPSLPAHVHAAETSNILSLRYDDRYDITGKVVEIVDAGTPTSFKVGYGVVEGTLDDAVITLDGNKLIATGIGTAQVKIDGILYEITVEAAPISLLLILGQSNAEGMEGNANQSIVCPDGQVYSTYAKANGLTGDAGLTVENAGNYIPSALTGPYSTVNINGTDTKLSAYPVNSLTEAGAGKYGMDSGLAYEWVRQTDEKVWVINAAHGASSITSWQKGAENYDQAVALFTACQKVLQMEIGAGHYTFSHMGYYWNQGCADETRSAQWYAERYIAMHENLKQDLACDMDNDTTTADNTLEFGNIVLVQAGHSTATGYRKGTYTDTSDSFFMTYKELELRGPRVAQIWMANNPELPDIHIVCTLAQDWVTMLDGSDGVAEYFHAAYKNGIVDYTTQVKQSDSWYAPTTPAAVKDSIHYNQIGYNEIGRESARNTLYILGILEKPQVETTVTFLDWTGYQQAGSIKTSAVGTSDTLVVPLVYPCYESKTVSYTLSGGLDWTYYDLLDTETDGGTLTASVGTQTVKVIGREFYNYRFELVDDVLVSVSDINFRENLLTATASGTYTLSDPILLKHDNPWVVEFNSVEADRFMALSSTSRASDGMFYFFKSKSGSGVLALGEYKDGLYQNYGLKQSSVAIDWTQPHVYQFRNVINDDGSNTIHIFIDNKWVGIATNLIINDVLQSADNMYLSGKDLTFTSIGCNGFALSTNQMTYLQVYEEGLIPLSLRYDDRYDITGKTVEIVGGEGVVAVENDTLRAVGVGNAMVRIDGKLYDVTVDKAKINIVVIMGQSNAGNHFANATSDVTCSPGTAYWWKNGATEPVDYTEPSKGFHTPLLAELYAQSAAAGDPVKNVMVWQEGVTSKNGQSIVKWAASETDTSGTDGTATMIKNCIAYYEQNSDKFEIVNCGVYWLQGESDVSMSPEKYTELFMAMWDKLKDAGAEYVAFFRLRWGTTGNTSEHHDLGYTGSLTAQLQMINDNADMFMASTVTENWEGNETTEHSVDIRNYITLMEEYGKEGELNDSYGNAATFKNGILTTTMKTLYGSNNKCHYGKFGYGIIGADAAYNMYHALHTDEFSIVQTDTSGKAAAATISKPGDAVTIDITEMTENLAFRASCGSTAGTLDIQVLSGDEDITEQVIANGVDTFGTVDTEILREYEDVTITVTYVPAEGVPGRVVYKVVDNSPAPPEMYYWDFENDLNARDENGEIVNSLGEALLGSYVLEEGIFKATGLHLALEKSILLREKKNWSIEWKFGEVTENSQGFIFSSRNKNEIGNKAFYHVKYGQFMISDYVDSKGYRNYTLEDVKIKTGDVIKITNRYDAQAGRSIMSLWQNGKLVIEDFQQKGSMNGYTSDLDMTGYPLSGDFTLSYMGSGSFIPVTEEFDYIKIILDKKVESLSLRYDDRYDITGKTVEIVDAGTPTSFKVGYGVVEGTLDDAVITLDGNKLIATGIGTAQVKIDGILYEITVEAAPISLLLLIGQSNMRGSEGNADQSIVCPDGMVYATFGDDRGDSAGVMNVNNATNFAASALAGQYSTINVNGTTDNLSFYPINSLTEAGKGTFGPDSGFAYEWVKQTGEKVWIVNAAHGGSSITSWQPNATNYKEAVLLFSACQETLRKEIAAGHFTLSHMGYFWCQGCTDRAQTAQWYVEKYLAMHNGLKDALAFDHDSDSTTANVDFEFAGIIPVRVGNTVACYRDGNYEISNPYSYHESFVDLRFSGPRVAQYWMINNPDLPDIWGVCNIGEDWVWMPDGTNGVSAYFQAHYPGGTVDYTTQVPQSNSWYTPTTPKAVHDSVHYNQIGYNEIGRESARNALILLGEIEAPQVETTVEFLSWDGYTPVDRVYASASGNSGTLVVPKVYPIWNSKTVQYELSAGLTWNYYDLLSATPETTGTLTAGLKTVTVIKAEPYTHFIDHLAQLPENICSELNLWSVLEHDEAYYASGTAWGVHSSGNVPSVTFFIQPGDKIFATSFGAAGTNGHATSGGIRVTFFSEYGVAKTMSPAQVYAEFTANGGYLVAPEGAVAINIPMWDNSDNNEIYILNRAHFYEAITIAPTCKTDGYTLHKCICGDSYMDSFVATTGEHTYNAVVTPPTCAESGYTTHTCLGCGSYYTDSYVAPTGQHSFSDWTATKVPTPDSLGEEQRTCSVCDLIETQEVEGVWQIYDLAAHLIDLPEHICCDTNLWALLPHENVHFTSGKRWGTTGTPTTSITIPVNPGDRIYATSWNKAGENGHATSDGIRLTFFDAYGIALTLGPGESYRQFAANGGYLVAPEGTVAINIVMWYDSEDYEVYILNRKHTYAQVTVAPTCTEQGYSGSFCKACCTGTRENIVAPLGHSYSGTVCTRCGAEHPNAADYSGKVISILGDSISTFAGYIPVADGFNLTHLARYPQDNLLTDVNETWWMQTIAELDGKLGINDSWRGSTVSGYPTVTTGVAGYLAAMSNLTQIQNLGSNGTPDVILFYGGTNDLAHTPSLGTFDPATAPTEVDLTTLKWNNLADAYSQTLLRLKHFYPNTQIICLLPTYTTSYYSNEKLAQGNALMASICEHYGITYIDLRDCGISTADLPDGIHPDATGMDYITNAVLEALLAQDVESGENVVHSVTHDLTGATSSLGYYKGVSDGKAFITTIAGDDLTVTVTMGGVDITAQVYADGVITIPAVIGDLVITAEGRVKPIYEEHLQLPDPYYGVDLWKTLAHDDEYFYIDAWTVHSSGNVYSVTFPVTPGDKIVASSFGAAGSNGATMNGIRITWFDTDGVLHSAGPAEVYAEFDENGYLTVPEGAVAVNIPMWTNTNQWELYVYDSSYEPTFSLGDHLQQLPEDICAGTNLWNILKPENAYYTGSAWGNLTTDQVWSVTIAVTAGDQIWATSFQKYGSNGNNFSTNNGIRITWFGANGVLKSVTPEETYKEFSSNGYITVPDGAVAVNIPMWSGSNSNELYILNLAHVPGDPVRENEGPHGSHDVVTYCSVCGEELSREHDDGYLPGDINGDGLVNNKDVTRLFQYLSDYDVEVVEEALDVNGDGSVNNKDLTRLFQYLSDYDVELH